ncbi:MAG: hypothetical protein K0S23_2292 [Fluviicola sp.]|jgi:hypothetical protein|uniref:hypothetical protein n=1 Tax=Fluviicola sp. TaxID=1917219 RepID=UPI00260A68A2|nr:hypothetical protein [Fluviicola sp.]MDF3027985.1 hypothetical protein [Fluviicola sp.]
MKNSEHKQLDQLLKDKLSDGTASVPDFVWDRIEEELFPEKKRRGFFWWFFSGLCLVVIGGLLGVAFSGQKTHSQNTSLSNNSVPEQLNTPVLRTQHSMRKNKFITLNPAKTKGSLSAAADEHATKAGKYFDSNPDSYRNATKTSKHSDSPHHTYQNTNLRQKKSGSSLKKQSGSQTKSVSSNSGKLLSEKTQTDPLQPSNGKQESLNNRSTDQNSTDPATHSTSENQATQAKAESAIKADSISRKELSYAEILDLVKRDFSNNPDELDENKKNSLFSLGIYGGPSLYNTAAFKDYFSSGQLSKRTFASSGFELGLHARFKIGNRFRIYAGLAFNQKQTQFNYNLAITEFDYFTYLVNGEKVPLANIRDDGANSCFLAKDVLVRYQIQSALISLGTQFEFLKMGRFSAAADLRLSCNIYSSLKLKETRVLDIQKPNSENFSYFQPGAGLLLNYEINSWISVGLSPFFSKQFYLKESSSRKMDELVIPVTVSFNL